jgi:hypothetical protein
LNITGSSGGSISNVYNIYATGTVYAAAYNLNTSTFTLSNTASSTSTTTGALVVTGGVGIGGNLYVGGTSTFSGNLLPSLDSTYNLGSSSTQWRSLYVSTNTIYIGGTAVSVAGGILQVNGAPVSGGGGGSSTGTTSTFVISNTITSTSTTTGALIVAGGVGIGGNLNVAGTITANQLTIQYTTITQTLVTSPDIFTITNTTVSSNTQTGALTVAGGVGVGGNVNIGGTVVGGGIRTTSTSTPPVNPTVGDIWYNTSTDDIYRYTTDGTSSYWLDINGPSSGSLNSIKTLTIGQNIGGSVNLLLTAGTLSILSNASGTVTVPLQ